MRLSDEQLITLEDRCPAAVAHEIKQVVMEVMELRDLRDAVLAWFAVADKKTHAELHAAIAAERACLAEGKPVKK